MVSEYPYFTTAKLNEIEKSLSKQDHASLKSFLAECATTAGPRKVKDVRCSVLQFIFLTGSDISKIDYSKVISYLTMLNSSQREQSSKYGLIAHIKRFLRWRFEDWPVRFKNFKIMRMPKPTVNEKKINPKTLLTPAEIELIMKKEKNMIHKTFFICAYESGMRPAELRKLRWKDLNFGDDGLSEITIFMTKTGKSKTVYLNNSTSYLKSLAEANDSEFVFQSREGKNRPISSQTAVLWVRSMGRHIGKVIYPYLLRHTRSQELYDLVDNGKLSENVAQRFLGHGRSMRDIYQRLDSKTLKSAIKKAVYDIENVSPEKRESLEKQIIKLKRDLKNALEFSKIAAAKALGKEIDPHEIAKVYEEITGEKIEVVRKKTKK